MLVNIITDLHKSTKRNYFERMTRDKPHCMQVASRFDESFFDGDRKFGYGGYVYDGRWKCIAKKLIEHYGLNADSKVLDIGCGKGFLACDLMCIGGCSVDATDISDFALDNCPITTKFKCDIGKDKLDKHYDLIISINTLHNLILPNLKHALEEIVEHSDFSYIVVESYRTERELFNLECWNLTGQQFLRPEEWEFLFKEFGYKRDYEFIFFE